MPAHDPKEAHKYLAGLALANTFEIEELRRAPIELKLRQLYTLMSAVDLFESQALREAEVNKVRGRWARLYQALGA